MTWRTCCAKQGREAIDALYETELDLSPVRDRNGSEAIRPAMRRR